MSNLIKHLNLRDTGMRTVPLMIKKDIDPFNLVSSEIYKTESHVYNRFDAIVTIKGSFLRDSALDKISDSDGFAINNLKKQIVETVFGEFRVPLMKIYQALSDYDVNTARKLLCEMETDMFSIE